MAVAYLFPNGVTDADSNIASGAVTDIDEGVEGGTPDANVMAAIANQWTNQATAEILFDLTNLPGAATGVNNIILRVRAGVFGDTTPDDTVEFTWDVVGTGVGANTVIWDAGDAPLPAQVNRETSNIDTGATVANVNALQIRVRQTAWTQSMGKDGMHHDWDGMELEVDYTAADPNTAQLPSATLTLTNNAPQAVATEKHIAQLPSATLTLAPFVPTVETFDPNTVTLPSAALTLTPNVPTVVSTDNNFADLPSAALTLTPNVPQAVATEKHIAELPSEALTLTPNVPQSVATEKHIAQLPSATLTVTPNVPQAVTTEGVVYEQEGFRFRNDDGTEITATWRQTQDVDDTINKSTTVRVRVLTDTSGDAPSITRTLQVKRDDEADTEYRDV